MNKQDFYAYARGIIATCFDIMEKADAEYASDADKFSNFKWQAEAEGRTPEQVAITFFLKHVRSLSRGISIREPMEGRICDIINYALLIGGMRAEQAGVFVENPADTPEKNTRALKEAVGRGDEPIQMLMPCSGLDCDSCRVYPPESPKANPMRPLEWCSDGELNEMAMQVEVEQRDRRREAGLSL